MDDYLGYMSRTITSPSVSAGDGKEVLYIPPHKTFVSKKVKARNPIITQYEYFTRRASGSSKGDILSSKGNESKTEEH